jgi:hypothetical protein
MGVVEEGSKLNFVVAVSFLQPVVRLIKVAKRGALPSLYGSSKDDHML